jgi:hypothetical protein
MIPLFIQLTFTDYLEGGLKMTNIDTYIKALQIKWILRLLENSNDNWKIIPQKYFENIGENFLIFNMNLDSFKSLENELIYSFGIIVQEPINVMLGSISDLNTVILPINEMFLWFQFFIIALHLLICFS